MRFNELLMEIFICETAENIARHNVQAAILKAIFKKEKNFIEMSSFISNWFGEWYDKNIKGIVSAIISEIERDNKINPDSPEEANLKKDLLDFIPKFLDKLDNRNKKKKIKTTKQIKIEVLKALREWVIAEEGIHWSSQKLKEIHKNLDELINKIESEEEPLIAREN